MVDDIYLSSLTKIHVDITFTYITIFNDKIFTLDSEGYILTCTYTGGLQQIDYST